MGAAYMDKQVNIPVKMRMAFYSLFSMMVSAPYIDMISQ